jgi:hypothetical protein
MDFFQRFFSSNPFKEEERRGQKRALLEKDDANVEGLVLNKRRGDLATNSQSIEKKEQEASSLMVEKMIEDEQEALNRQREFYLQFKEGEHNHRHDFRHPHMNFLPIDSYFQLT